MMPMRRNESRHGLRRREVACLAAMLGVAGVAGCAPEWGAEPEGVETVYSFADYYMYETIPDLAARSDAVVRGKVLSSRYVTSQGEPYVYDNDNPDPVQNPMAGIPNPHPTITPSPVTRTVSAVEVLEVFRGDPKVGEEVEVYQFGGMTPGGEMEQIMGMWYLSDLLGEEIVIFLNYRHDEKGRTVPGEYSSAHDMQGLWLVGGGRVSLLVGGVSGEKPYPVWETPSWSDPDHVVSFPRTLSIEGLTQEVSKAG